jgi:phosphatidate cytidylyltransferase
MNNLLVRTISGIGIILVVLGSILLSQLTFFGLILLIFSLGYYEFRKMFKLKDQGMFYGMLIIGLTAIALLFFLLTNTLKLNSFIALGMFIIVIMIYYLINKGSSIKEIAYSLFGLLWIGGSLAFFMALGWINNEKIYIPFLIVILQILIWVNDIGAFLIGSYFGKRPMASSISPGKTWEGFLSGMLLNAIAGFLIFKLSGDHTAAFWIITALIVSLSATAGDLLESKIKREAGIKDTGNLIPGHGGVLDRFDSLLFSAPIYYIVLLIA